MYFTYLEKLGSALQRNSKEIYCASDITKFKKIIDMKEKFAQNMEVPVPLMEFLLQTQWTFGGCFCLKFYIL